MKTLLDPDLGHQIEALYAQPLSILQVAQAVGWTYDKTRYHLLKRGVKLRIKGSTNTYARTAETRARMSAARKKFYAEGGRHPMQGNKKTDVQRLLFIEKRCRYQVNLQPYLGRDIDKLVFLMKFPRRYRAKLIAAGVSTEMFLAHFYDEPRFNRLYQRWLQGPCKWTRPSLDHKVPAKRGGSWALDNLQFMTWRENRDKDNMTQEEWMAFRQRFQMDCMLYERL